MLCLVLLFHLWIRIIDREYAGTYKIHLIWWELKFVRRLFGDMAGYVEQ